MGLSIEERVETLERIRESFEKRIMELEDKAKVQREHLDVLAARVVELERVAHLDGEVAALRTRLVQVDLRTRTDSLTENKRISKVKERVANLEGHVVELERVEEECNEPLYRTLPSRVGAVESLVAELRHRLEAMGVQERGLGEVLDEAASRLEAEPRNGPFVGATATMIRALAEDWRRQRASG